MSDIKLMQGDCLELLKTIPDKSVDLVVTDPPYEFTNGGKGHSALCDRMIKKKAELANISHGFDFAILDECRRVLKADNFYVWCSKMQLTKLLNYFVDKDDIIDVLTWHKTNPSPTINGNYLPDTEYCIFAKAKGVYLGGTYETKHKYYVTPCNVEDKKWYKHPTIKPLNIITNLVFNSSKEGDTVLDCFMGSGTTGVACKNLNRNFIGMEINEEYFKIAKDRVEGNNEQISFADDFLRRLP